MSREAHAALVGLVRAWLRGSPPEIPAESLQPELSELARGQRVAGLLYELAAGAGGPAARALQERLRPDTYRALLQGEGRLRLADRATALLHSRGIAVLRLKGAALLPELYSSAGLRPMDDVDLLVREEQLEAAAAVLEGAGFHRPAGLLADRQLREHHFHLPLHDRESGSCLELHWELADRFKRGSAGSQAVWSGAVPYDPARPERGLRLAPDLEFLHLALHVDKHGPFHEVLRPRLGAPGAWFHPSSEARLIWLVDLVLHARRRPWDFGGAAERAGQLGLARPVARTLGMARELLGPGLLPEIDLALAPSGPWCRWIEGAVGRVLTGPRQGWIGQARRMDPASQVRPLRLLELPLLLFPPFGEFRHERRLTRLRAAVCYPRHVLAETWKGIRFAAAIGRQRWSSGGEGNG